MTKNKLPKIITIIGPTASGKSDLAVKIAREFNGEIVSADSRQIYRGMDIGTAKPPSDGGFAANPKSQTPKSKKNRNYFSGGIRHYLIDNKNPDQDYSAGQYKKDALGAINKIIKSGKLPILVGGTGLYVDAVVKNLEFPRVKENKKLRARLEDEINSKGLGFVFKELVRLDPEAAYIIDPKNPRRVIRALEVALTLGKPFSAQRKTGESLYNTLEIGIAVPRRELKEKIAKRTKQMVKDGLVGEVEVLAKRYGPNCKAFDAIGYREIIDYLRGEISLAEAMEQINKNTWHYARRQIAWFRKNHEVCWIRNPREVSSLVRNFVICS